MAAYLILALVSLIAGFTLFFGLLDQLRADPPASLIDTLIESSMGNPLARAILMDAVVVGVAFLIWLLHEARSLAMRRPWIYVVLVLTTPIAFVVPLFLFMREWKLKKLGWD